MKTSAIFCTYIYSRMVQLLGLQRVLSKLGILHRALFKISVKAKMSAAWSSVKPKISAARTLRAVLNFLIEPIFGLTVLLMEEILRHLINSLSHYLQSFIHPSWLAGFLPSIVISQVPRASNLWCPTRPTSSNITVPELPQVRRTRGCWFTSQIFFIETCERSMWCNFNLRNNLSKIKNL